MTRGTVHSHEPDIINRDHINDNAGCHIHGSIVTDKVGGNFRFIVEQSSKIKTISRDFQLLSEAGTLEAHDIRSTQKFSMYKLLINSL